MATPGNKVYVIGVGMSKFIKPRGEVDYPGKRYHRRLGDTVV